MPHLMSEEDFQVELDADMLMNAQEIRGDSTRFNAAVRYLRSKADRLNRQAEELTRNDESDLAKGFTSLGGL